jgi:hypothetical protein
MTKEEIIEGNRLIAEFCGAEWVKDDYGDYGYKLDSFPVWNKMQSVEALKYHTSWDWLMPVLTAIGDIDEFYAGWKIESCECYIWTDHDINNYDETTIKDSTIEAVYLAVISFIKWHNSQSK